jgi:hypothetical protein
LPDILSSEIGCIGRVAHELEEVLELRIVGEDACKADVEYTHLTVDWSRKVITD